MLGTDLSPFLNRGVTFASLNCTGSWLSDKEALKIKVIGTVKASAQFFNKKGWSLSTPQALFWSRAFNFSN